MFKKLNEIFRILDIDSSGTIKLKEFNTNLEYIYPLISYPGVKYHRMIENIFNDFDLNKNGNLEKNEFELFLKVISDNNNRARFSKSQLSLIFSKIDVNNNGLIDLQELLYKFYLVTSYGNKSTFNQRSSFFQLK